MLQVAFLAADDPSINVEHYYRECKNDPQVIHQECDPKVEERKGQIDWIPGAGKGTLFDDLASRCPGIGLFAGTQHGSKRPEGECCAAEGRQQTQNVADPPVGEDWERPHDVQEDSDHERT
jgi:hypothetical protein